MRQKRACYAYKNHELVGFFNSINEASDKTKENTTTIRNILEGKQQITRIGYVYTNEPLTEEEIQSMPTIKEKEIKERKRFNDDCKKTLQWIRLRSSVFQPSSNLPSKVKRTKNKGL